MPEATAQKSKFAVAKKATYSVHPAPFPAEVPGFHTFSSEAFWSLLLLGPLLPMWLISAPAWSYPIFMAVMLVPSYLAFIVSDSHLKNWAYARSVKVRTVTSSNPRAPVLLSQTTSPSPTRSASWPCMPAIPRRHS